MVKSYTKMEGLGDEVEMYPLTRKDGVGRMNVPPFTVMARCFLVSVVAFDTWLA